MVEDEYIISDISTAVYTQRKLMEKIDEKNYNDLISKCSNRLKIKLNNYKYNKESNAWIRVRPCLVEGIRFKDVELDLILKNRLDINIINNEQICRKCNKSCDKKGDHAFTCGSGNGRYQRHDKIKEFLFKELKKIDIEAKMEPKNLIENTNKRPADVLAKNLFSGEDSWIDVGIRHVNYDINDVKKGNSNILNYEKEKINKYKKYIDKNQQYKDSKYRPFMIQTDGIFTKNTKIIIKKIIEIKKKKSEEDISILTGRFKSRITARLMKLNAVSILQHYKIF